jgi:hypothetical protein
LHHLISAQKAAIMSVYAAGLVILTWRGFHLRGTWRLIFAFALAVVIYFNILALSAQIPGVCGEIRFLFQAALLTAALSIGILAARRFTERAAALASIEQNTSSTSALRH